MGGKTRGLGARVHFCLWSKIVDVHSLLIADLAALILVRFVPGVDINQAQIFSSAVGRVARVHNR